MFQEYIKCIFRTHSTKALSCMFDLVLNVLLYFLEIFRTTKIISFLELSITLVGCREMYFNSYYWWYRIFFEGCYSRGTVLLFLFLISDVNICLNPTICAVIVLLVYFYIWIVQLFHRQQKMSLIKMLRG